MTVPVTWQDVAALLPEFFLVVWASALLLLDVFWIREKRTTAWLSALGFVVALVLAVGQMGRAPLLAFRGMVIADAFSVFLVALFALSGLVGILLAQDYLARNGIERGEFYVLLMFSVVGMMLMARVADLVMIFLALELFSLPLYVMTGFARPRADSEEAALKYFLLGAFASGFMAFGIALVYGATSTTSLPHMVDVIQAGEADLALLTAGAALVLTGLGFKIATVPFHMWTPDVYHGAPSPVSGFMAATAKMAGFAALLRLFVLVFPVVADLTPVLWALAALSMVLGNVAAIAQRNIKRLLAYSSIAHAGYMLSAAVAFADPHLGPQAVAAILFYLVAYVLATFGAWGVVILLERRIGQEGLLLEDYAGLSRQYPGLAAAMAVFMLSFIGVPPTLGFFGKFYLFRVVLDAGFVGLALIGVLTSLVSAYYYLRVVMLMYMKPGEPIVRREPRVQATVLAAAALTLFLGLTAASSLYAWATEAILRFG